jgi:GTP-binding protein EngB required for normal cell division
VPENKAAINCFVSQADINYRAVYNKADKISKSLPEYINSILLFKLYEVYELRK